MPVIDLAEAASRSFDYIIVGGGIAGLTLASRLSEDAERSVLVLEAGKERLNDRQIWNLGKVGYHLGKKEYDWDSMTVAQTYCNDNQFDWSRGKLVGGSEAINFMAFNKPPKRDIDEWELLGNKGWNWERFDKYMRRATTYTPPALSEAEHARRGTPEQLRKSWRKGVQGNGPIQVSYPPLRLDVDIKAQEAFQELGVPVVPAPLDGDPNGIVVGPTTVDPNNITRSYSANAYWAPNSGRPNFHLLAEALAHRLISTEVNGELTITGVEFSRTSAGDDKTYVVNASKEVILCTSTLKTPQILELSGIGRPDILEKVGIPVRLALEGVGENVQEHIHVAINFELKDGVPDETYDLLGDPEQAKKHEELFTKGQGIYTMGICNFAFVNPSILSDKANDLIPDARTRINAEIAAGKYSSALVDQYKILFDNYDKGVPSCEFIGVPGFYLGPTPPEPGKKYYTFVTTLNALFSRGTIHITSSDPKVDSAMDPHYYEQDIDLKLLVEAIKFARKVARADALKEYFGENPVEINPGPAFTTDEEIADYLKKRTVTIFHTIGSASMLPREKNGVVYGAKNLRIVDLSIAPSHFGSHSQSVAYGIGEIVADIIKGVA